VHPYVVELPAGTITNRTYAIGLGLPGNVSDAVLNQITSNTAGDLIITGNLAAAEQAFNLTKYFVQILAGVTNMNIVLDPQGSLFFGSKHVVPFDLIDADVYVDVIALCPLPQVLDFQLETPGGTLIRPSTAGAQPNIRYLNGQQVLFYRLTLPALTNDPAGSHAGKWKAILSLKGKGSVTGLLSNREFAASVRSSLIAGSVPYWMIAHAYSNVQFDARLGQDSLRPGATLTLLASLSEYDVPLVREAAVWAEILDPALTPMSLRLARAADGTYSAEFKASLAGVYACRVRAEGYSSANQKFTREKRLTGSTHYGDYTVPGADRAELCELLRCLVADKAVDAHGLQRLKRMGIDLRGLRDCLSRYCEPDYLEHAHGVKR